MRSILQVLTELFRGRKTAVIPPRNSSESSAGYIGAGSAVFFTASGTDAPRLEMSSEKAAPAHHSNGEEGVETSNEDNFDISDAGGDFYGGDSGSGDSGGGDSGGGGM